MAYTIQEVGARARSKNPDLFTNFTDEQIGQRLVNNNPGIKALVEPTAPKQTGSNFNNWAEGVGKGEFKTLGNLMNAVQTGFNAPLKATNWISNQLGGQDIFDRNLMEQGKNAIPEELRTAYNPAQQAGMTTENIAEFFLPGSASLRAGSAVKAGLNAPKIIKGLAGLGTTMGIEGVLGTGQSALQSGKLGKEELKTGLYSLAAPAVIAGGSKAIKGAASTIKPIENLTKKIGTYAKGRLPKALGIFSGENNDVIEEALKNPKLANIGIDGGDVALRNAVEEGATNSIKIKNAFVQGYTQAKDQVMGKYTKTLIPKPNIVGTFNKLLKENDVLINKDGTLDFTRSLIKANPGEVSKIEDAYDALKAWNKFDINSLDDYKQLVGKLTHFATEAGVPSKSPFLGRLYNNLNNIAYSRLPKEIASQYKVLNTNFSKNIGIYDDIVDAFNSGDPFTKLANALGKNKDSLRQIINFYEKQSGSDILPIVAGRELGMEKQAAFGFLNPRSWIDFIISPQLQGKIITGIGSKLPKAKLPVPALKSTIESIEGSGKINKLPSINKAIKPSVVQNITKNVADQLATARKDSEKLLKIAQKSNDIKDWTRYTSNQHLISSLEVEVLKLANKAGVKGVGSAEDIIGDIIPKGDGVATPKTANILEAVKDQLKIKDRPGFAKLPNLGKKIDEPLITEARKYKTAEEFIKSIPETNKPQSGKIFTMEVYRGGVGTSPNGTFFSPDIDVAKNYAKRKGGGLIKEKIILKNPLVIDASHSDALSEIMGKLKKTDKLYKKIDNNIQSVRGNPYIFLPEKQANLRYEQNIIENIDPIFKEYAERNGYDGIIRMADETPWGTKPKNGVFEVVSFNGKTKSQLIDIWNKANMVDENILRGTKGMTANDIMTTYPNIKLTKEVKGKDISGKPIFIEKGEKLTPYELKGNKILLQDGETYIVSKNQFQNIKGQSVEAVGKPFAPELNNLEESVKMTQPSFNGLDDKFDSLVNKKELLLSNPNYTSAEKSAMLKPIQAEIDDMGKKLRKINIEREKITPTKFSSQTLPGAKNYREILIKAPLDDGTIKWSKDGDYWQGTVGDTTISRKTKQEIIDYIKEGNYTNKFSSFKSSHWDEPNVISHIRLNDRTYKGKKVTFMEELQSDWAREARKGGETGLDLHGNPYKSGTPTNPNLKKWQELSIKRALKDAVDNKSDYFAWTTGEQQSARYNLSTKLDDINWNPSIIEYPDKTLYLKNIVMTKPDGGKIKLSVGDNGIIEDTAEFAFKGKKLDEILGKGLAEKIMASEKGNLSGEGLKFGGEWTANLYDRQVKNIVEDLTGQKVEMLDLGLPIEKNSQVFIINIRRGKYGHFEGDELSTKNIKIGQEIRDKDVGTVGSEYIITDILGDGKFKAIPKSLIYDPKLYNSNKLKGEILKGDFSRIPNSSKETFDISQKLTQQQGIKLTPEVKAKIQGKAPVIKTSGKLPFGNEGKISKKALFVGAGALTAGASLGKFAIKPKENNPVFVNNSNNSSNNEENRINATMTYYDPNDASQTREGGSGVGALNRPVQFGDVAVGNRELLNKVKQSVKNGSDTFIYIPELKSWKTPWGMGIFRINDTMNIRYANENPPKIDIAIPSNKPDAKKLQSIIGKRQMTYEILD